MIFLYSQGGGTEHADAIRQTGRIEMSDQARAKYLDDLADDYGVDSFVVYSLADILGPNEDHDGLITALGDYADAEGLG